MQPPPSDAKIVPRLLQTKGVSDDDYDYSGEVTDEPVKYPDKNELMQLVKKFSLFIDKGEQSNLTLVELKVKSISTLLGSRRSKHPSGTF